MKTFSGALILLFGAVGVACGPTTPLRVPETGGMGGSGGEAGAAAGHAGASAGASGGSAAAGSGGSPAVGAGGSTTEPMGAAGMGGAAAGTGGAAGMATGCMTAAAGPTGAAGALGAASPGGWVDRTPTTLPSNWPKGRRDPAMAFDSATGRTVLYGGYANASPVTDTWEWDGALGIWRARRVSPPSVFDMVGETYDTTRNRFVIFGGESFPDAAPTQDLWEWDGVGGAWTDHAATGAAGKWPGPRTNAAAAYDPARRRVVIHGGGADSDTWEWAPDTGTWSERTVTPAPAGEFASAFVWDVCRGRGVLFGGATGAEVWEWDGVAGRWTRRMQIAGAPWPAARSGVAMTIDATNGRPLLFGGRGQPNGPVFNDLWQWNGEQGQWTLLDAGTSATSSPPREAHGMVYDVARSRLVVFGGGSETGFDRGDVWEWTRPAGVGAASPGPMPLVSAPGCGGIDLVVAGGTLFWTESATGTVNSIPTAGGATTSIATAQMPGAIAADDSAVFWSNLGDRTIMKKTLPAGAPAVFGGAWTDVVNALLVDNGTLYVGSGVDAFKIPTTGGPPIRLGHSPDTRMGRPAAFALDATFLYQTELDHISISRERLDGTQNGLLDDGVTRQALVPDRLALGQGSLVMDALAVVAGHVVWANGVNVNARDTETNLSFVSIATSAGFNPITGFVVSGDTLYLGESGDDKVEKIALSLVPPASGPPSAIVIADKQASPGQFAADAKNIYWRTSDCKIMKMAK